MPCCAVLRMSCLHCCLVQVGIITDIWLWHGALVDVLADYKGWVLRV